VYGGLSTNGESFIKLQDSKWGVFSRIFFQHSETKFHLSNTIRSTLMALVVSSDRAEGQSLVLTRDMVTSSTHSN